MPRTEVPLDVLDAARQTPRVWGLLPVLSAWYRDARTGRIDIEVPAPDTEDIVGEAMPDDVLTALASAPGLWPITLEIAQWAKDGRTGRLEVEVVDGTSRELRRVERVGFVQRLERLALGRALNLPEGAVPVCPVCRTEPLHELDYGNRYFCPPCDRLWTVWELKRHNAFRVARG